MKELKQQRFTGERALFGSRDLVVRDCLFEDGESPLKESADLKLYGTMFRWKYPLWYCTDVLAEDCVWYDMARAGVWYSDRVTVQGAVIQAPKNFRRCRDLTLRRVTLTNAQETLWSCTGVVLDSVTAKGDYFAMNSTDLDVTGLTLDGNYGFDGCKRVVIRNSALLTKDAFWNCEDVTVYDSFISGEYFGWNSRNVRLVNCTVESLQGLCYIDGLVMENCRLLNTTLAFEYSTVKAEVRSVIDSVFNPAGGRIEAEGIRELILEDGIVNPDRTEIVCGDIGKVSDRPEWKRDA
ncbi:MAG: DUF3737 family protein [Lachnospiraceae bacterium]|nr:DUF3737 family protein [Lachnospiraceae bacterium]MBP5255201.1 DUF3737 family protein [Lachnospiraceae bacterium]